MKFARMGTILLILGLAILLSGIAAIICVEMFVPDISGSDPQKDQYRMGFFVATLLGVLVFAAGGVLAAGRRK